MERKKSIFSSLSDRSYGLGLREDIRRNIMGSNFLIKRLKCEHVFVGHEGCVNTVVWNESGEILLSGSDDCNLNIYQLTSMKPVHSIPSGHHANIFSAKFLPCTSDTKIVSCSGDGILHYNDINSHFLYGQNPFRCHAGTTYEVNTTPGDPHTFMSSGEDGTVRLFDLRSKTNCRCEGCREDVLIDCEKAVTSFNVNPVYPYYVAVGCENSMVRVYDRRSLTTLRQGNESNKQQGLLYQYKPKALERRDCRVTSLKYSTDGQSLLASFCSDYVYLFDSNPKSLNLEEYDTMGNDETDRLCPHLSNDPPMKRLRLRGDWSDTGPNARPECEDSGTSENSFVQRMSGYLTRWIEESLRSTRRQRRRSNPRTAPLRQEEALERSIRRDENPDLLTVEECDTSRSVDNGRGHQETGTTDEVDVRSENKSAPFEDLEQDRGETPEISDWVDCEHQGGRCCSCGSCKNGGKACVHTHDPMDDTSGEGSTSTGSQCDGTNVDTLSTLVDDRTFHSESSTKRSRRKNNRIENSEGENDGIRAGTTNSRLSTDSTSTSVSSRDSRENGKENKGEDGELKDNSDQQSVCVSQTETLQGLRTEELGSENQDFGSATRDSGIEMLELDFRNRGSIPTGIRDSNSVVQESETGLQSSITRTQNSGGDPTLRSRELDVADSSESDGDDSNSRRNAAASTIQNFFRFRYKKDSTSTQWSVPIFSNAKQIYKGHRNARTMIKEANFWGDDFILSGSDCGRIFIWSRRTAELVMLLEGDRHVVNCVQPHPYDPILATSGIDYDVKLWTPTALNVCQMENGNEVVARNEKMLKESRDTLTVPASFMIRVLSSLHRVRFNTTGNEQSSADSDSEWDEDE